MKTCMICRVKTENWEKVGTLIRCWPCGKLAREGTPATADDTPTVEAARRKLDEAIAAYGSALMEEGNTGQDEVSVIDACEDALIAACLAHQQQEIERLNGTLKLEQTVNAHLHQRIDELKAHQRPPEPIAHDEDYAAVGDCSCNKCNPYTPAMADDTTHMKSATAHRALCGAATKRGNSFYEWNYVNCPECRKGMGRMADDTVEQAYDLLKQAENNLLITAREHCHPCSTEWQRRFSMAFDAYGRTQSAFIAAVRAEQPIAGQDVTV